MESCSFALTLEPAPEYHPRRRTVDIGALDAPAPPARAAGFERLVRLERGEALIDQLYG
jgi:hypothetical protein